MCIKKPQGIFILGNLVLMITWRKLEFAVVGFLALLACAVLMELKGASVER